MRIPLVLTAAAAVTATAVPAHAAYGPVCTTRLVAAAAGAAAACTTGSPGDTHSSTGFFRRVVTVEVAAGAVEATLHCFTYYRSSTTTRVVTSATVFSDWDDERCDLTLRALQDGTTATATSTFSYTISPY